MNELIGNIAITLWLLSWFSLSFISAKYGLTPMEGIIALVKRII